VRFSATEAFLEEGSATTRGRTRTFDPATARRGRQNSSDQAPRDYRREGRRFLVEIVHDSFLRNGVATIAVHRQLMLTIPGGGVGVGTGHIRSTNTNVRRVDTGSRNPAILGPARPGVPVWRTGPRHKLLSARRSSSRNRLVRDGLCRQEARGHQASRETARKKPTRKLMPRPTEGETSGVEDRHVIERVSTPRPAAEAVLPRTERNLLARRRS